MLLRTMETVRANNNRKEQIAITGYCVQIKLTIIAAIHSTMKIMSFYCTNSFLLCLVCLETNCTENSLDIMK